LLVCGSSENPNENYANFLAKKGDLSENPKENYANFLAKKGDLQI
jgi:hypothetical protein